MTKYVPQPSAYFVGIGINIKKDAMSYKTQAPLPINFKFMNTLYDKNVFM